MFMFTKKHSLFFLTFLIMFISLVGSNSLIAAHRYEGGSRGMHPMEHPAAGHNAYHDVQRRNLNNDLNNAAGAGGVYVPPVEYAAPPPELLEPTTPTIVQ